MAEQEQRIVGMPRLDAFWSAAVVSTTERAGRLREALVPPAVPLREPWHAGLGGLVGAHPRVPAGVRRLLGVLDRFGQITLELESFDLDGERVRWNDVTHVRLAPVVEVVSAEVLHHEIGRLTSMLPPVPGRKWLVRQATDVLVGLCFASAATVRGRGSDHPDPDGDGRVIPAVVVVRTRTGHKDVTPSLFSALVCAAVPGVTEALITAANAHGAAIGRAAPSPGRQHAQSLRALMASFQDEMNVMQPEAVQCADISQAGLEPAVMGPPASLPQTGLPVAEIDATMARFCHECGTRHVQGGLFCGVCGTRRAVAPMQPHVPPSVAEPPASVPLPVSAPVVPPPGPPSRTVESARVSTPSTHQLPTPAADGFNGQYNEAVTHAGLPPAAGFDESPVVDYGGAVGARPSTPTPVVRPISSVDYRRVMADHTGAPVSARVDPERPMVDYATALA